jgi:hypothetical protein
MTHPVLSQLDAVDFKERVDNGAIDSNALLTFYHGLVVHEPV